MIYDEYLTTAEMQRWILDVDVSWNQIDGELALSQPDLLDQMHDSALIESYFPLYTSRLMSARIEGFSPKESDEILEELFDISEDPSIVYQHDWKLGDLVIWDNWCSIHARRDFPRNEPRLMRRLTIEGRALHF